MTLKGRAQSQFSSPSRERGSCCLVVLPIRCDCAPYSPTESRGLNSRILTPEPFPRVGLSP